MQDLRPAEFARAAHGYRVFQVRPRGEAGAPLMPRAVSPQMWRIALRDHWQGHTSVLLTLYTIGTYMDRNGMAYPGQKTLATAIRATVKTVQRHIETAERAGFLSAKLPLLCGRKTLRHRHRWMAQPYMAGWILGLRMTCAPWCW